jgi:Tol biopolymer transport system component
MTGHSDFDRTLAGWFEAEALPPAPASVVDRALDATRRRGPRPAWLAGLGSHWVGEERDGGSILSGRSLPGLGLRWSTAIILLLVMAALVAGAILVGARLPEPSPLSLGRLGHLAYALDGDIYVADWDGSNSVRIADGLPGGKSGCGPAGYRSTIWSPDGRYLAYRSGKDQVSCPSIGAVRISDPNGHVVASFPGDGDALSWSPDATRVATWADWERTIGIYGLDGTRQALLTLPPGFGTGRDEDPVWSPDGASLLISLRPDGGASPRQTWELPVDGRTPWIVPADDPRSHWYARYSADGARVAYLDHDSLVVAGGDVSQPEVLISGGVIVGGSFQFPVWSATGDRIAFSAGVEATTPFGPMTDLRLINVATREVTTLAAGGGNYTLAPIKFSPAGDRILYSTTDVNGQAALWSVNADGAEAQLLVRGTDWGDWQWLPADR